MKNTIIKIILLTLLFNSFTLIAQDFNFGIKAGYNLSTYKVKTPLTNGFVKENSKGIIIGIQTEFSISDKISLMPELFLTSLKTDNGVSEESHHFLLFPILGKYEIFDRFSILLGPQLNYTISKPNENIKKLNIAINTGLMFDVTSKLSLQSNYALGINNTANINNYTAKYDHLYFTLGYKFL